MFENNNLWLLLFSVLPAIVYSYIIYKKAPEGVVRKKLMWSYIAFGLVSIQILHIIHFIFPNIHNHIETMLVSNVFLNGEILEIPTTWAIFVFAFFQVAFIEEFSKWITLKIGNLIRGNSKNRKDSAFAVMFYSIMIAVGFAAYENIHYVGRTLWGDLKGHDPNQMLIVRSLNAVTTHMISGLFIGYFIALGRECRHILKRIGYTALGLITATAFHGLYDFNLMKNDLMDSDFVSILELDFHITNNLMILSALVLSFFMGKHLLGVGKKDNELLR